MNETQTNIKTAKPETGNSSGRYLQTMVMTFFKLSKITRKQENE
uniref:Uncharacterized protein n=1 Tax=viral metagenome TaxID=1070528 RepID=A0A6M3JFB3_9ZZZZ